MGVPNGTTATSQANPYAAQHSTLASHFIGGNRLEVAPPSSVKDFVTSHGGHSVITSVSSCVSLYFHDSAMSVWNRRRIEEGGDARHCGIESFCFKSKCGNELEKS